MRWLCRRTGPHTGLPAASLDGYVGGLEQLLMDLLAVRFQVVAHADGRALVPAEQHDLHVTVAVPNLGVWLLGVQVHLGDIPLGVHVVLVAAIGALALLSLL